MGEPAWSNEEDIDRLHMRHHIGMHGEIHNVYGLTWDKVVKEQFEKRNPGKRVFQMTRAAYAGLQRYTFGWSGDSGNGNDLLEGWGGNYGTRWRSVSLPDWEVFRSGQQIFLAIAVILPITRQRQNSTPGGCSLAFLIH